MKRYAIVLCVLSLLLIIGLTSCSNNSYSIKKAVANGDVVYFNDVQNYDRFREFLSNIESQQADSIRVTGYTDEGDPIIRDLRYDGDIIHFTYDSSRDQFGGQHKGIYMDTCSSISSEESEEWGTTYYISDCTINNPQIGYFLLRVEDDGK